MTSIIETFKPADFLILVVDDIPKNVQLLMDMLEKVGYTTSFALNGHEALEVVNTTEPDLILLDLMMPVMSGLEVCQKLKEDSLHREIPIIFLTASHEEEHLLKAFEVGAVDYVTKPFKKSELLSRVRTHLEFKHIRDQLHKTQIKAEAANQAKSQFLANMSHELRNPLNAILGFSELILFNSSLSREDTQGLEIINSSAQHLLKLINGVLDLAKIEAGKMSLNEKEFDLFTLLKDLKNMFSLKADNRGLDLIIDWDKDVPRYICSDEVKLNQILINLISNAIKFTSSGTVSLKVSRNSDTNLRFEVKDTGAGIPPEEIGLLFKPFQQTLIGSESGEGTGLGLSISQKFVRLMGGDIKVNSIVNQGTTFSFDINVSLASEIPVITQKPTKRVIGIATMQEDYRLLVVDDVRVNRLLLNKILTRVGFTTKEAKNGLEAIELWENWRPHLIFMDVRMPVIDGIEATQKIRSKETKTTTKIIALTASLLKESRLKMLTSGYDDILYKPYKSEDLFMTISKHLKLKYIYN